jgi:hypothetical protein
MAAAVTNGVNLFVLATIDGTLGVYAMDFNGQNPVLVHPEAPGAYTNFTLLGAACDHLVVHATPAAQPDAGVPGVTTIDIMQYPLPNGTIHTASLVSPREVYARAADSEVLYMGGPNLGEGLYVALQANGSSPTGLDGSHRPNPLFNSVALWGSSIALDDEYVYLLDTAGPGRIVRLAK